MRGIKKLRLEKKLTQKELGRRVGLSSTTIYMFENNKIQELSPRYLERLANVLETTVDKLCKEYIEEIYIEEIKEKKCLNESCLLNSGQKCQSVNVCKGAYCQNQNLVTSKRKKIKSRFKIKI